MSHAMLDYPNIAARLYNTPILLEPGKLIAIIQAVETHRDKIVEYKAETAKEKGEFKYTTLAENGQAFVHVNGTLVSKSSWIDALSGLASYDILSREVEAVSKKPGFRGLNMLYNSPGGEVSLLFDLADQLKEIGRKYPTSAIVNDKATSAAYLLASTANEIVGSQTSTLGSIGVVLHLQNLTKLMEAKGVENVIIYKGSHKVDGHPLIPFTKEALANINSKTEQYYELFVNKLAEYTGKPAQFYRDTEANIYIGQDAVDKQLANKIVNVKDFVTEKLHKENKMAISSDAILANTKVDTPDLIVSPVVDKSEMVSISTVELKAQQELLTQLKAKQEKDEAEKAKLQERLAALEEANRVKGIEAVVKQRLHAVPVGEKDLISLLSHAEKTFTAEQYNGLVDTLAQCSTAIENGELLHEIGDSAERHTATHVSVKESGAYLEAEIAKHMKENKCSKVEAQEAVLAANPNLYEAMIQRERDRQSGSVEE